MYYAKFILNFRDVIEPLRKLTIKDQPFLWDEEKKRSFKTIKKLFTSTEVMAYFDPCKEIDLVTDVSPSNSSILMQNIL